MSAQVKLRSWVTTKPVGEEFTTKQAREFLKASGFSDQSGTLLTYMVTWWKIAERVGHGRYRRVAP